MTKDVPFPLSAVVEAAATELAGKTLLCPAQPRANAAAAAAGSWRCKDFWETELKQLVSVRIQCWQIFSPIAVSKCMFIK